MWGSGRERLNNALRFLELMTGFVGTVSERLIRFGAGVSADGHLLNKFRRVST
jgi:hypothetical protein